MWICLGVTGLALLLSGVVMISYEYGAFRKSLVESLAVQAKMIDRNVTAAMTYNYRLTMQSRPTGELAMAEAAASNKQYVEELLGALRTMPNVIQAVVYLRDGTPFANYHRNRKQAPSAPPVLRNKEYSFGSDSVDVVVPMKVDGEEMGAIYIQSDLEQLHSRMAWYSGMVVLVFSACVVIAFFLLSRLQAQITGPILELSALAAGIATQKDYSARTVVRGEDEVGSLARSFNEMLTQIQERDVELENHRFHLEEQVARRTSELEQSKGQLERELAIRKTTQERLARSAGELERSNRELRDFIMIATHDLNEPLRKVQVIGDLLAAKFSGTLGKQGEDYLARMQKSSARMQQLLGDLIAFSRVSAATQTFSPVDLEQTVRETVTELAAKVKEAGAVLETSGLPRIEADAAQMRQLFAQLLDNALKFRKEEEPPRIKITGEAVEYADDETSPCWIRITVEDNGIGFDPKYAEKIFRVFQKLHGKQHGTGIGLAICHRIVERHGGGIAVTSTPGKGSAFMVTLPVTQHTDEQRYEAS